MSCRKNILHIFSDQINQQFHRSPYVLSRINHGPILRSVGPSLFCLLWPRSLLKHTQTRTTHTKIFRFMFHSYLSIMNKLLDINTFFDLKVYYFLLILKEIKTVFCAPKSNEHLYLINKLTLESKINLYFSLK